MVFIFTVELAWSLKMRFLLGATGEAVIAESICMQDEKDGREAFHVF